MGKIGEKISGDSEEKQLSDASRILLEKKHCPYDRLFCFDCTTEFCTDHAKFGASCFFFASYVFYYLNLMNQSIRMEQWH
jgi:hypothetical protein